MASQKKRDDSFKNLKEQKGVMTILNGLYGNCLDVNIIESVANSQQWNLQKTIGILSEMLANAAPNPKNNKIENKNGNKNIPGNRNNSYSKIAKKQPKIQKPPINFQNKPNVERKPQNPSYSVWIKEVERIRSKILSGYKILIFLRGVPGSGKSYLAKYLISSTLNIDYKFFVFSTDDYFQKGDCYNYNPNFISEAHNWNQKRVSEACYMGISPIIVDNTNLQEWEMICYAKYAVENGYMIEMLIPNTAWSNNAGELSRRNIHSVPKHKIEDMLLRFDKKVTPNSLIYKLGIHYPPGRNPPQFRHYPPVTDNQKKIFNIPPLIQRNNTPKNPQLPKENTANNVPKSVEPEKKKQKPKQKKKKVVNTSDNINIVKVAGNLESAKNTDEMEFKLLDIRDEQDSDTWESDEEEWNELRSATAKKESSNVTETDLITIGNPSNMEYVLVNPDNTYTYQKDHGNLNEEFIDLINFDEEDDDDEDGDTQELIKISDDDDEKNHDSEAFSDLQTQFNNMALDTKYLIKYDEENAAKGLFDFPKLDIGQSNSNTWDKLLKSNSSPKVDKIERKYSQELLFEMSSRDVGTNTMSIDFSNLTKSNKDENVKIVFGIAKNINENFVQKDFCPPPKVLMLEKGTMTTAENIIEMISQNTNSNKTSENLSVLRMLFPNVPNDFLQDLIEKCQGDINWAGNLLLENNVAFNEKENENITENVNQNIGENVMENMNENVDEIVNDDKNIELENNPGLNENIIDNKNIKHLKGKFKASSNEELKKQIEEQVRIGDQYYSDHLLNLRKKRYGIVDPPTEYTDKEETLLDISVDNQEVIEDEGSVSSEEEIMEFNFGINFIDQLENQFGNPNTEYPKGFQPVIQLPASLGKQLHSLWLESVCTQMQTQNAILHDIEKQDMEFAKVLQEKEKTVPESNNKVPDLQEIMDMEIALAVYRADQEQWKKETPNDLASRMTRQKLFESFPMLSKDLLTEILQAHDNNFDHTVQALLCSLDKTNTDSIINIDGKIMSKTGNEDIAKQKQLLANEIKEFPKVVLIKPFENASNNNESDDYDPKKSANYYRDLASHHLEMRQQLYLKASDAIKKGMTQVASYYSDVAKLHKQKYEYANHQAAAAFLSEHSMNHNNSKLIDLHYLYVKEAEQALAMFLDCHISHMQQTKQRQDCLFIITGRGKNSQDGVSHIKPVVKRKLKERKLRYVEMNPGLLKVTITKHSILTNDIKDL